MGTLKISFQGVCTHFHGVVPGVPHRVVLPRAGALRFGILELAGEPSTPYFLMPHLPVIRVCPDIQTGPNVEGIMKNGNLITSVRIQVANGISGAVTYLPSYEGVQQITNFVDHYEYADDVVLGGRASCYVDLFGGQVGKDSDNHVIATIQTADCPKLLITPFFPGEVADPTPQEVTFGSDEVRLIIANVGTLCPSPTTPFDYLLHYLTAKGGIPRVIQKKMPGMPLDFVPFTQESLNEGLQMLQTFNYPHQFEASVLCGPFVPEPPPEPDPKFVMRDALTPACSDSRYP